ncbi:hypothetical protein [Halobellus sp. H-GB7]|uniref:hypothetical protein n=1 Tax=Halobellus sp. H-GB7 TaxID=3069756 RepID=UPI0027B1CFF7|nr:hypothetical protein [Halobellus sp. H-GB7]MDQ2054135.1 hypothetical protein [Halobellus sp. H-GB7]
MSESLSHKAMKFTLASAVDEALESKEKSTGTDLFVEKGVDSSQVGILADVRLDLPHKDFKGFLFEVKARCNKRERTRSIHQLASYLRAGYHPVLVAPSEFYDSTDVKMDPKHHRISYQRIVRSLGAHIIDVTAEEGLQFKPVSHHQYDSIEEFLFDRT